MKKGFFLILACIVQSIYFLQAQNPADVLKSQSVVETQNVEYSLAQFPEESLFKSVDSALRKQGKSVGVVNRDGSIYVIGAATTSRPSNMSGFVNSRNIAYSIAEMTAKMNLLRLAGETISSGRGFQLVEDVIDGEDPDAKKTATCVQKAAMVLDKSLDKALSELGVSEDEIKAMNTPQKEAVYQQVYNQTIRSLVSGMVKGCSVVRVAEGELGNNDYQVAVCLKYSPEFQSMVAAMERGSINFVPIGAVKNSREKILTMHEKDLVYRLGVWVTYDANGKMVVYGFGQQEVHETGSRLSAAVSRATSQARLYAINNIKHFVAEDILAQETQNSVEKLKEYADGSNAYFSHQHWQQAVASKETTLNIATEQVRTWRAIHPISNTMVVGYIVALTYENATTSQNLKQQINGISNANRADKTFTKQNSTTKGVIIVTGQDDDL